MGRRAATPGAGKAPDAGGIDPDRWDLDTGARQWTYRAERVAVCDVWGAAYHLEEHRLHENDVYDRVLKTEVAPWLRNNVEEKLREFVQRLTAGRHGSDRSLPDPTKKRMGIDQLIDKARNAALDNAAQAVLDNPDAEPAELAEIISNMKKD